MKKLLKIIKLNESSISMVLGIIVVIIVSTLIVKYLKSNNGKIPAELLNQKNSVESSTKTHKVEKNQNLWQIAVIYYGDGFKWVDIATENKLANAGIVEVGQELRIPNVENEESEPIENTEVKKVEIQTTANDSITGTSYTVVKGDSLWKIAVRAYGDGYKWVEVARENKISKPNFIYSGNVLTLPR